ncbi:SRPBCC family protein [Stieleria varia]|uniref:Polyketide cyclase / dehydrase and lipid transport n=1 Tax=Stieleria varia TaxID=2528005 RepID=A0A5C6B208_9BACT|nr:SRPBCC family protein [Stieleria varia]TWU05601.1 Polyketide cyclase / dehydrase and lipid transport [Stieleria varia]
MPAFHVERSVLIDATPEKVFETVSDYATWTAWSPWLPADRDAKVTVSEDSNSVGSRYHWAGPVVGEGEMRHLTLKSPQRIEDELNFLKPHRSKSKVTFEIVPSGQQTKVTWHMDGKLPWFMFWMTGMMKTFIGMDFQRGLKMLKELIETGTVLSNTEVDKIVEMGEGVTKGDLLIGIREKCSLDEVGAKMQAILPRVQQGLAAAGVATDGDVVSVYHPVDIKCGDVDFTTGWTVPHGTVTPSGLTSLQLSDGEAFHVRHTGSYENLGNAWSAAYQYARAKKIKLAKRAAFEVYRNDPAQTPCAELVTDIYLPV